jgi:hypothetical protein
MCQRAVMRTLSIVLMTLCVTTATAAVSAPASETGSDQSSTSPEQPPATPPQSAESPAPNPVELQSGLYEADTLSAIVAITPDGDIQGYLSTSSPGAGQARCDIVFSGHADGVNPVDIDTWRPWRSDNGDTHIGGVLTPTASGMAMKLSEGTPYTGCDAIWQTITSDLQLTLRIRTKWSSICRTTDHRVRLMEYPDTSDTSYASLGPYSLIGCGQRENDFIHVESILRRNDFHAAGWVRISDINDRLFDKAP